jgi:hypothetical protein
MAAVPTISIKLFRKIADEGVSSHFVGYRY